MESWECIQKAIDWIEQHIGEKMEILQLSGDTCLSPFYFQRLFKRLTGRPVMEYIKLRRLARAADELLRTGQKISDIALEMGYENHETFTRAFKEIYGATPTTFRKQKPPVTTLIQSLIIWSDAR